MENGSIDEGKPTPIPIEDFEVDPKEIMAEIQSKLLDSGRLFEGEHPQLPPYHRTNYPEKPDDIPYDLGLYQLLDSIKQNLKLTGTELDIRESGFSRLPIIGRLWRKMQWMLHGPAHYYANRTAERQAEINGQVFQILSKLLAENQERQREIARLQEELEQLRGEGR